MPNPFSSLLLLGPTGSGKSPLGDVLEQHGLTGRTCVHFDFGRCLRQVAEDAGYAGDRGLVEAERETVTRVLREGALLERESFRIALKLFDGFVRERVRGGDPLLVMNGLPRHVGQARFMDSRIRVDAVILLECGADAVADRIRRNRFGDRGGRMDDDPESVGRRWALFQVRIRPLADYYTTRGARLVSIPVGRETTAEHVRAQLVHGM